MPARSGEQHHFAKLTEEVALSTIGYIVRRETWKDVDA